MERRAEIVTSKRATETRSALLQENDRNKEDREDDLYVGKYRKYDRSYEFHALAMIPQAQAK